MIGTGATTESVETRIIGRSRRISRDYINRHHTTLLVGLLVIVAFHWIEHVAQAIQVWFLGVPPSEALGFLGAKFPWLVRTESLHWILNAVIGAGLICLRPRLAGRARRYWNAALYIQAWHMFEHTLLLGQYVSGLYVLGRGVPTSILQLWIPRMNLHLFYNGIVTLPLFTGAILHLRVLAPWGKGVNYELPGA
jgi:hypothetical protein